MHTYILRRVMLIFPTLLGITLVVFVVMAAAPGGISSQSLVQGMDLEPEKRQAIEEYYNKMYGLDDPAPIQYLKWLNNVSPIGFVFDNNGDLSGFSFVKGSDWGFSFRNGRPVLDLVLERVPITLLLNLLSIPIIYLVAIAIGMQSAVNRGKSFDVGASFTMLALWSVPTMLAGVLLIGYFASDQYWHWFPTANLSDLDALDMPFLPHWQSFIDILWIFLLSIGGTVLLLYLARWDDDRMRVMLMSLIGAGFGYFMASTLVGDTSVFTYVFLMAGVAALAGVIAYSDFIAMRFSMMGFIGMCLGLAIAISLSSEGFIRGFLLDRVWHLILPVICLSYGGFAFLSKLTRTSILENLLADFTRTARAKGVDESTILWGHVFRNSLLPLITVSASLLPSLLAGSVIVESIFSIEGMGKLAVEAVKGRDRELVLSITLVSGMLTLVSYLIADICYAIVDPRVSYD